MGCLILIVVGIPLLGAAFAGTAVLLGLLWPRVRTRGPKRAEVFYARFLVIATAYVVLRVLGVPGLAAMAATVLAYKLEFAASWTRACVVGLAAGGVGWVLLDLAVRVLASHAIPMR